MIGSSSEGHTCGWAMQVLNSTKFERRRVSVTQAVTVRMCCCVRCAAVSHELMLQHHILSHHTPSPNQVCSHMLTRAISPRLLTSALQNAPSAFAGPVVRSTVAPALAPARPTPPSPAAAALGLSGSKPAPGVGAAARPPATRGSSVRVMATASAPLGIEVPAGQELAVLGGGCFWCLEACYQQLRGVSKVVSGYAGGPEQHPTYEQVCSKRTGHAEVVGITYDPAQISFRDLLDVFFTIHDPTTPNRQGADVGPQYRSIILYTDEQQKQVAEQAMADVAAQQLYPGPVVTELVPLERFWAGEAYHQNYFNDNPGQGYCRAVVAPKVAKFRSKYISKLIKA